MGAAITANTPSSGGGPVVSYSISAGFSATGLTFDTSTGVISGTPTALCGATSYTVTATNSGGSTTALVTVTVIAGPAASLALTGLTSPSTAGATQTVTVTARDALGNVASGYRGTVHFTSTDAAAVLPADYVFTTGDAGSHTFTGLQPRTAGTQAVTASDSASALTATVSGMIVQPAALAALSFSVQPSSATAGAVIFPAVQVSARDAYGNLVTAATGIDLSLAAGPAGATLLGTTSVTTTSGASSFPGLFLQKAGAGYALLASSGLVQATSASFSVGAAALSLAGSTVSASPASITAGGAGSTVSVTVVDGYGNPVSGAVVTLASSFPSDTVGVPAATSAAGATSAVVAGTAAGLRTITASVGGLPLVQTATVTVGPAAPDLASCSITSPAAPVLANGSATGTFSAVLRDAYGNPTPSVSLGFSATQGSLGATTGSTGAAGEASVTLASTTAGAATVTVVFPGGSLQATVAFIAGPPASFQLAGLPASVIAGAASSATVTARDAFGNVATGYRGAVHFTSTDPAALVPADYTFTAGDAGAHTFALTLKTAGVRAVTATDTAFASITGTASTTVSPGTAASLSLTGLTSPWTAGATQSVTVTARDAFGNVATGYRGAVLFASTDAAAVLPAGYTFTAGDAGSRAFIGLQLRTAGTQAVTATDTVASTLTATASGLMVQPAALASLSFSVQPTSATAGAVIFPAVQVSARDAYGNLVTAATAIDLSLAAGPVGATLFGTTSATTISGASSFPGLFLQKAGAGYALLATSAGVSGSSSTLFDITAAAPSAAMSDVLAAPTAPSAGATSALTVTLRDAFGNPVSGKTVSFTCTGSTNTLTQPASATSATGVASGSLSSTLAEAKTVTATVDGTVLTARPVVTFVAGAPSAAGSTLLASPASAPNDGTSVALTVTVRDGYGNPVAGQVVVFSSSGTASFTQPAAVTGADGKTSGGVSASVAGVQSISAKVGATLVAQANVTFTAVPPADALSTVTSTPVSVPADGTSAASVTVTLKNQLGLPLVGATVALAFAATGTIAPATASTSGTGVATFSVTSSTIGAGILTATVNPGAGQVVLSQHPWLDFAPPTNSGGSVWSDLNASRLFSVPPGAGGDARFGHVAVASQDGLVYAMLGESPGWFRPAGLDPTVAAFEPRSGVWTALPYCNVPPGSERTGATATLLRNGKVLVVGGLAVDGSRLATTLIFHPKGDSGTYPGYWTAGPTMTAARHRHTATLLADGRVLVAGGQGCTAGAPCDSSHTAGIDGSELYTWNTAGGSFAAPVALGGARFGHSATRLPSGSVVLLGGFQSDPAGQTAASATLANGGGNAVTFTARSRGTTGNAVTVAYVAGSSTSVDLSVGAISVGVSVGVTTLADVVAAIQGSAAASALVTAAIVGSGAVTVGATVPATPLTGGGVTDVALASARTWTSGTWSATGSLGAAQHRAGHTATLLPRVSGNPAILVAGGTTDEASARAELIVFDPVAQAVLSTTVPPGWTARYGHTASLLPGGQVLVAGGSAGVVAVASADALQLVSALGSALLPKLPTVRSTSGLSLGPPKARMDHTATVLADGAVALVGGHAGDYATFVTPTEFYDPAQENSCALTPLPVALAGSVAVLLRVPSTNAPRVLVAFGRAPTGATNLAYLFDPIAGGATGGGSPCPWNDQTVGTWTAVPDTGGVARTRAAAVALRDGRVLVIGGQAADGVTALADSRLFDPATLSWSAGPTMPFTMPQGRWDHTATALGDGRVLVAGGTSGVASQGRTVSLDTAVVWSPIPLPPFGNFTETATRLTARRAGHRAALLADGTVLLTGGVDVPAGATPAAAALVSAELLNPATLTFSATSSMNVARVGHTLLPLPDGRVLAAFGEDLAGSALATAETFGGGSWSVGTFPTALARNAGHRSAVLPDGKVVSSGGTGGVAAKGQEQFHPVALDWRTATSTDVLVWNEAATAVLLPSGKVLTVGGAGAGGAPLSTVRAWDEGLFAPAARKPVVTAATAQQWVPASELAWRGAPGRRLSVTGTGFGASEGGSGDGPSCSQAGYPLLRLQETGSSLVTVVAPTNWTATSIQAVLPASLPLGIHLLTVSVNGVASAATLVLVEKLPGDACALNSECANTTLSGRGGFCKGGTCCATDCPGAAATCAAATGLCTGAQVGQACVANSECISGNCTLGQCAP
jgi:hypothetical protein